jgi:hypothetical protein
MVGASDGDEAAAQIRNICGSDGYVKNMTLVFHSDNFGEPSDREDGSSMKEELAPGTSLYGLRNGLIGKSSTVLIGNCYAGGNPGPNHDPDAAGGKDYDYTPFVSNAFDGATVYGQKAPSSSFHFMFYNSFSGLFADHYSLGRQESINNAGIYSVTSRTGGIVIRRTTKLNIRIDHWGNINESPKFYNYGQKPAVPLLLRPFKNTNHD